MATQVVELSGDEAALLRSLDKVVQKQLELDRKLRDTGENADAFGVRMEDALAKVEAESNKALKGLLAEMKTLGPEGQAAATALKEHLQGAGKAGMRSMDQVIEQLRLIDPEAAAAAQAASRSLATAGKESESMFDSLGGKVAAYVGSIGLAAAAVDAVRRAWVQVQDEQADALKNLQDTQDPDRRLLQVSDSQQQFRERRTQRDDLAMQFGVDRTQVSTVIFDAISQGFEDSVPEIVRASQVIDPNAASAAGGKLSTLFDKEQLTATQTISATLVGAKSSEADFETLAKVLPVAAEGGRQLGASFAETAAAVAVLTSDFATAATAADRFKAFSSKAALDEQFKGKDITDVVEKLSQMSAEQRKSFLGESQEVNAFYSAALPRIAQIREQAGLINQDLSATAAGGGALNAKVAIAESDPELIALRSEARAQQRKIVTEVQEKGIEGATASAAAANVEAELLRSDNLATRTIGKQFGVTSAVTGSAVALGATERDATTAGVVGSRVATDAVLAGAIPGYGIAKALLPGFSPAPADPTAEALLAEQRRQTALLEQQNALLQQTATNTVPQAPPVPSVTPALANQQP